MTMRACLYARYSTDKQRETSVEDQLREARARAKREGWAVTTTYSDEGISGSTPIALRPGGKALLADALATRFDVLIVEGLDRLSRELGEAETMVKRLEHRGIRIIGTADGYDTNASGRKVMRIARGLVNELYLDDLREKTHRGLAGQFDRGFSAGGRAYGYRSVEAEGGKRLVIDETEADIVREIFRLFAAGQSARSIAHRLNERGVPSPRGGTWAVSALSGDAAKGLGLLNNEMYVGRWVWNKRQWLKDPDTGARRYIDRPREEWQTREMPELRIVTDEVWQQVRARYSPQSPAAVKRGQPMRTLFGGLLKCAACGGPMIGINSSRYGCGVHKDRGDAVCNSSVTVSRELVDTCLLEELRDELLAPDAVHELQEAVRHLLADDTRSRAATEDTMRKRIRELQGEIARLVDAIAAIGLSNALQDRLRASEGERARLEAQLITHVAPSQQAMADEVVERYQGLVLDLQNTLNSVQDRVRTRQILADLLGPITIGRDGEGELYAELEEPAERLLIATARESLMLVAGAGFEPTTFGL
jgi:site-specific DNA recombinase